MNTTILRIRHLAVAVLIALALLFGAMWSAAAQKSDFVIDQQFIEIDGVRPIGLSPDGQWLAATDAAMRELCVYDAITVAVQSCANLEALQAGLRLEDVVWSPDSTRLALAERSFQLLLEGDLWVMEVMTGELTNVTDDGFEGSLSLDPDSGGDTFSFDVSPAWTPDGTELTYSRSSWIEGEFQGNDIVSIPAGGGNPESLVTVDPDRAGIAYYGMEWTLDGSSLFYSVHSPDADDPGNGVYRYDRKTGSSEQVLAGTRDMRAPAVLQVSSTGNHLLVWYPFAAGRFDSDVALYWLVDLESGDTTALTAPGENDSGFGWIVAACFSPDGQSLLTATRNTEPDAQLWITDIGTGEQTQLVESLPGAMVMEYSLVPSWTASGRIFVPASIGSGTLLTVEGISLPEVATPMAIPSGRAATPQVEWTGIAPGQALYIVSFGVPVHVAPSATAQALVILQQGAEVTVIGPAEVQDGVVWIFVQDETTRTTGFVRAIFLGVDEP